MSERGMIRDVVTALVAFTVLLYTSLAAGGVVRDYLDGVRARENDEKLERALKDLRTDRQHQIRQGFLRSDPCEGLR